MAKGPATSLADNAASERDLLLATKLFLPHPQREFVPRRRLLDRLDETLAQQLVLVCAPAGFGKTTVLADWVRRGDSPAGWLSLDAGDNDPARFWRHVVAALDRARPGIAEQLMALLGPPAPPSFDGLVTALINELAQPGTGDVVLILDDYHLIDSAPVHQSVTFLLDHLPAGLHLVIASRADPPLALARLRARGQLAELRAADLRFSSNEAAALLSEAAGLDVSASALSVLEARTEGWAAGLRLAALSLRGAVDVAAFLATFSGSHRYVLDYLTEEVLERQTDQVRVFLLETSVLERLNGPLCDAVTGRADGQAMLEAVEAAGLFLMPLDEIRGWWRYHQLFADLLRTRLQQERPDRISVLHRNAAAWYQQHGLPDDAVRHLLAANDAVWAARLIEQHFDALYYLQGERTTVQRWLSALPDDLIRSRPRLLLAQAAIADSSGQADAVDRSLAAAERASTIDLDEPFEPSAGPAASLLVNVPATIAIFRAYQAELRGDAKATAGFVSRARAAVSEGESMLRFITQGHQAVAEWLDGRLATAEDALSASMEEWRAAGHRNLIGWGCYHLGQVQRALGRMDAARETYQQTLKVTVERERRPLPAAGIAYAGLAEVAYQRNDLDEAFHHAITGIPLCRQFTFAPPLATALATLAWTRQATGDTAGALDAMDEAMRAAPGPAVGDLLNPVPAQRARLLLALGDVEAADRWTDGRGLRPGDEPEYPREGGYLVLARVLLTQERADQALPLLARMRALAAAQGRTGSLIEIQALQALALASGGDDAAALDALAEALLLGHAAGHLRVFADEGAPMRALVGRLIAAQRTTQSAVRVVPLDYLARLLSSFDEAPTGPGSRRAAAEAPPGLVEVLTAREAEVLVLIAAGKSNPRIAEELVVTLDTVKKHVSHVLGKLGAANRTEAVTRARQLGLIA